VPADNACTSSSLIEFAWDGVTGAADYQVRIRTPKGNDVVRNVGGTTTRLRVNLGPTGDGDGQYLWTVAAIDGGMQAGNAARNSVFFIDTMPPRAIAVDAQDPSPGSRGVITAGETRIALTFNEVLLATAPLSVRFVSENRAAPPLPVTTVTLDRNLWTGRLNVPVNDGRNPDYNGLGELSIQGARDCAGNLMVAPDHGLVVFEINAGPFLRVAFFQNPIDRRDLIVLLKGFAREGGPSVRLIDQPVMTFRRQGEPEQSPALNRLSDSTFQGLFRLTSTSPAAILLSVTARDEGGNTATRGITLNVVAATPGDVTVVSAPSNAVRLVVGPGALAQASGLLAVPRRFSLMAPGELALPADGALVPVLPLDQFAPLGLQFDKPVTLEVDLELARRASEVSGVPPARPPAASAGAPSPGAASAGASSAGAASAGEAPADVALYQKSPAGWEYLSQTRAGRRITASTRALYPIALLADPVAPRVTLAVPEVAGRVDPANPVAQVEASDAGSGLAPDGVRIELDGRPLPVALDAGPGPGPVGGHASGRALASLSHADPGAHQLVVSATDRAGNVTRVQRRLVGPPEFGVSELVGFPNPARTVSRIRYRLNRAADRVDIRIHDVSGRVVRRLAGSTAPGPNTADWPLDTDDGAAVASGVYLVRMQVSGSGRKVTERTKIAVLR
jgi:hypothetical protein